MPGDPTLNPRPDCRKSSTPTITPPKPLRDKFYSVITSAKEVVFLSALDS